MKEFDFNYFNVNRNCEPSKKLRIKSICKKKSKKIKFDSIFEFGIFMLSLTFMLSLFENNDLRFLFVLRNGLSQLCVDFNVSFMSYFLSTLKE